MATARLFKSGNSQAVRIPKEFRLKGPEVEIFRRGDELVLRERTKGLTHVLDLIAMLPPEIDDRDDLPPQDRPGLEHMFDDPPAASPGPTRRSRARPGKKR
jgi:antitoxin VapB